MIDEPLRIRRALWLLPLGALVAVLGIILRGRFVTAGASPQGFAAAASDPFFVLGWSAMFLAALLAFVGLMALYTHLSKGAGDAWGLWGLLFAVAGIAMFMAYAGAVAITAPGLAALYFAGTPGAITILSGPLAAGAVVTAAVMYMASSLLFAAAVWRAEGIPRWTAGALLMQAPLIAVIPVASSLAEVLGALVLLAAGVGIAAEVAFEHRVVEQAHHRVRPRGPVA